LQDEFQLILDYALKYKNWEKPKIGMFIFQRFSIVPIMQV
jgi:hypothetical protein